MNSTFNNQLPPGFRFHPSDEELITHYLQNKVTSRPLPASIIAEINLYKHNPWELPKKALFGEDEWYFFSPRDRKYPNGQRPNRAAGVGYWKATGIDRPILSSSGMKRIGVKKALVFHTNRPSKGQKTNWTMNEYRLLDTSTKSSIRSRSGSMRLDDWVLCRVRHKGSISKNASNVQNSHSSDFLKEDARSISANHEMITDCLQKGCELLASILADQPLPPIENISTLAFEGSKKDKIFNSAHKDDLNKLNSPVKVSSVDNNFNLWKWKTSEGIENQELPLSNQNRENKIQDHSLPRKMLIGDNSRGFTENQSQNDKFDSDLMDSRIIMNWTWMIAEME